MADGVFFSFVEQAVVAALGEFTGGFLEGLRVAGVLFGGFEECFGAFAVGEQEAAAPIAVI